MQKFTFYTLEYQGQSLPLDASKIAIVPAHLVKTWDFECSPYLGESAITVGRLMNGADLVDSRGLGDLEAIDAAKGKFVAFVSVKSWNRLTDTGGPMPITVENCGTLSVDMLQSLRLKIQRGKYPTDAELADMKVPLETSAPPTAEAV